VYPNMGFKGEDRRAENLGEGSGLVNDTVKVKSCGCVV